MITKFKIFENNNNCDYFDVDSVYKQPYFKHPLYYLVSKFFVAKLIYISPDEYIRRIADNFGLTPIEAISPPHIYKENVRKYKRMMRFEGVKFDVPYYYKNNNLQEGRHRVLAAKELGCKEIPVIEMDELDRETVISIVKDNYLGLSFDEVNQKFIEQGYEGITDLGYRDLQMFIQFQINESILLEKIDIKNIINKIKNTKIDKSKWIKRLVAVLLTYYTVDNAKNFINNSNEIENEDKELLLDVITNKQSSVLSFDDFQKPDIPHNYKKGYKFILSQEGWDFIREEENLRLKAYKIGDGMITIGYGHAEPIGKSKYKIGDEISKEEAEKLLIKDLNHAANGVRRIFKQWEKEGIDVLITQGQFDAMVSMGYNMGINGLRKSDFIQKVKQNDMESASELITSTNVEEKFPGLYKRRLKEKEMFDKQS